MDVAMPQELTLAVVGIDFPNADGTNRRFEILMAAPGDPIELRPEPRNRHDANAVAVIGPNGVQIGYVSAERAPFVRGRIARGEGVAAIFQGLVDGTPFVRVRFGGGAPALPPARGTAALPGDLDRFYPDDDPADWGA